jgi:hypothetical protein
MDPSRRSRRAWAAVALIGALALALPSALELGADTYYWALSLGRDGPHMTDIDDPFQELSVSSWPASGASFAFGYREAGVASEDWEGPPLPAVAGAEACGSPVAVGGHVLGAYSAECGGDEPYLVRLFDLDSADAWVESLPPVPTDREAWLRAAALPGWDEEDGLITHPSGLVLDAQNGTDLSEAVETSDPPCVGPAMQFRFRRLVCAGRYGSVPSVLAGEGDREVTLQSVQASRLVSFTGSDHPDETVFAVEGGALYGYSISDRDIATDFGHPGPGVTENWRGAWSPDVPNRLILANGAGDVLALDLRTGEALWEVSYDVPSVVEPRKDDSRWPELSLLDGGSVAVIDLDVEGDTSTLVPVTRVFDASDGRLAFTHQNASIRAEAKYPALPGQQSGGARRVRLEDAGRAVWLEPLEAPQADAAQQAPVRRQPLSCPRGYEPVLWAEARPAAVVVCGWPDEGGGSLTRGYQVAALWNGKAWRVSNLAFRQGGARIKLEDGQIWDIGKGCGVLRLAKDLFAADLAAENLGSLDVKDELRDPKPVLGGPTVFYDGLVEVKRVGTHYCPLVVPFRWQAPAPASANTSQ